MSQAKKLFLYVLLNIVISAGTILGVLYLWENTKLKNALLDDPGTVQQAAPESAGEQSGEEVKDLTVEIAAAGGIGNLATEYIRLIHPADSAEDTVSLQNWRIRDEDNNEYPILAQSGLSTLELHSQGAVNIYTKAGESNPIELYLGLEDPMWSPGETVSLVDPQGNIHDTYLIP